MKCFIAVLALMWVGGMALAGTDHRGQVRFGEVPVPGAAVRAIHGETIVNAVTDGAGNYTLPDLANGDWTVQVDVAGFESSRKSIVITSDSPALQWDLKMLALSSLSIGTSGFPDSATSVPVLETSPQSSAETANRLLINGSVINGASTQFALPSAFGNNRKAARSLYTTTISLSGSSSVLDARSFSLTGQNTPKPDFGRM